MPGFRIATLGLAGVLALSSAAFGATLRVMTYNVHGLPPVPQLGIPDVSANMTAIAPLLENLHADGVDTLIALQEVFHQPYYDILTAPMAVHYAEISPKTTNVRPPSTNAIGDGLVLLSDVSFLAPAQHTMWTDCFGSLGSGGSDCDAPKGFQFVRVSLAPGLEVDVYNLHADAGQGSGSIAARIANLIQLSNAIAANSPGRAVIVLGDTNSLYTLSTDDIADFAAGLGLDDAWVESALGGLVPGFSATANNAGCPPPRGTATGGAVNASGANCELVDKIFFRSGASVQISLLDYDVALNFVDGLGQPLSDHLPVAALFDITLVPEPSVAALLALSALLLHAARRRRAER